MRKMMTVAVVAAVIVSQGVAAEKMSLEEAKEMPSETAEEDSVSRERQLQAQLERVQAEADTNRDKWLRAMAELDNFRKRSRQHLESSLNLARADVLKQLLEVLDNFERALAAERFLTDQETAATIAHDEARAAHELALSRKGRGATGDRAQVEQATAALSAKIGRASCRERV